MITKIDQASLGSQNRNYIANPGAEIGAVNWQKFTTTLTSGVPTGAPSLGSGNYTLNLTLTNPLRGVFGLTLSGGATTVAGTGIISSAFALDNADLAQVLTAVFEYQVTSGASFLTFSGTSTQTLEVWLYDVTAAAWVQPAGFRGLNQLTGPGKLAATFQSSITSGQQYRLAIIQTQTVSGTYVMQADGFRVGPQVVQYGSPVTDWVSYTPTINWTAGVGLIVGRYRRVGDSLHAQVYIPITGAVTAAQLYVSIPTGFTIDSTKLAGPIGFNQTNPNGTWTAIRTGVAIYNGVVAAITSTQVWLTVNGNGNVLTNTIPATWANNDYISCEFFVPVTGWSSTVQMSNDTDTRVVAANAGNAVNISVASGGETLLTLPTIAYDTHAGWTSSTEYTIPVSGYYRVTQLTTYTTGTWGAGSFWYVNLLKNGSFEARLITEVYSNADTTAGLSGTKTSSATAFYNAGQKLSINIGQSNTALVSKSFGGRVWLERVSGPSAIAASETVRARVVMSANQAFGVSVFYPNLNVKTYDSHNAMSAAGVFTAPISGVYSVKMSLASDGTTSFSTSQGLNYGIEKNGATVVSLLGLIYGNGTTNLNAVAGADSIYLNAGETIRMRCSSGVAFTAQASFNTFFAVERIGN